MKKEMKRIVLSGKDIMALTGKKERAAYFLMAKIRKKYNKPSRSLITIDEFCEYTGIRPERVAGSM
jgi:hypothetical protein